MQVNKHKESLISQEELRKRFRYCQDGRLERFQRSKNSFKEVGYMCSDGHLAVQINNHFYYVHRLIFFYHHGYFPEQVDHINRIKTDNRIENLRACTHSENILNRSKLDSAKSFSSKYRGVSWEPGKTKDSKHWKAYFVKDGRIHSLGSFSTQEMASKIRDIEVVRQGLTDFMLLNHPHLLEAYEAICFDTPLSQTTEALPQCNEQLLQKLFP